MSWHSAGSERPRGRVRKVAGIQFAGGGSVKTYFAKNGVFERQLYPARRGYNTEPLVYWRKLDPIFIREDGSFKK